MNLEQARFNMVEQQTAMGCAGLEYSGTAVDAEARGFLFGECQRHWHFVDMELPLGNGQKMAAKLEARVVQDLNIKPTDAVLEIGTGSGYLTALLAKALPLCVQRGNRCRSVG